jgi:flagellar biosynthetic protein FliQ
MDEVLIREVTVQSIRLALMVALPLIGSGMIVGFIIAIFQATTSIQEQTLTFIPKIIAIIIALLIFGPWIGTNMIAFAIQIFEIIGDIPLAGP